MKKIILAIVLLVSATVTSYADDSVTGNMILDFSDDSLPILNERFRQIEDALYLVKTDENDDDPGYVAVKVKHSIKIDSADNKLHLVGDEANPSKKTVYGKTSGGVQGWKSEEQTLDDVCALGATTSYAVSVGSFSADGICSRYGISAVGDLFVGDTAYIADDVIITDDLTVKGGSIDLSNQATTITLNDTTNALNIDNDTFVIDASNNRIGIGTNAPGVEIDIYTNYSLGSATSILQYYNGGILRHSLNNRGEATWNVRSGEDQQEVGSIGCGAPHNKAGIIFFNENGENRSDFRHNRSAGGFIWACRYGPGDDAPPVVMTLSPSGDLECTGTITAGTNFYGQTLYLTKAGWPGIEMNDTSGSGIYINMQNNGTEYGTLYGSCTDKEVVLQTKLDDYDLVFRGGNSQTEYMKIIGASGNVGIRDSSPDYPFEMLTTTNPQFAISNTDGVDYFTIGVDTNGDTSIVSSGGDISFNDENLSTTGTFDSATVNTGQGDYELYAMDQDVKTTDDVTFNSIIVSDGMTVTGDAIYNNTLTVGGSSGFGTDPVAGITAKMRMDSSDSASRILYGEYNSTYSGDIFGSIYAVELDVDMTNTSARNYGAMFGINLVLNDDATSACTSYDVKGISSYVDSDHSSVDCFGFQGEAVGLGINYAFYARAANGSNNYSFYGVQGNMYNNGSLTLTGDIAINGDDITCDGDLNIDAAGDDIILGDNNRIKHTDTSDHYIELHNNDTDTGWYWFDLYDILYWKANSASIFSVDAGMMRSYVDHMFDEGVKIGANTDANWLDDSSRGTSSTTMYIGNESIDTSVVSDERLKKNIRDTDKGLANLLNIRVRDFQFTKEYTDDDSVHTGIVAQELETIYPEAVRDIPYKEHITSKEVAKEIATDERGIIKGYAEKEGKYYETEQEEVKVVDYKKLVPLLIKSVQELNAKVETLEAKVANYKKLVPLLIKSVQE